MKFLFMAIVSIGMGFFLFSCSSNKPEGQTEAEVLFKQAQEYMKKERYLLAIEKLNLIKTQHPYSYYATHAELALADIQFAQKNYIEAATSYLLFRDLHPKYERPDYVIWRIAESHYLQKPSTNDRDLFPVKEAIKYYEELIERYSSSSYVPDCRSRVAEIKKMLLQQDFYVADFYYRTDVYEAARYRYLSIIKEYPDENEAQDKARERVVRSSWELKNYEQCVEDAEKMILGASSSAQKSIKDLQQRCEEKQRS